MNARGPGKLGDIRPKRGPRRGSLSEVSRAAGIQRMMHFAGEQG
jgi:hypothetical protein